MIEFSKRNLLIDSYFHYKQIVSAAPSLNLKGLNSHYQLFMCTQDATTEALKGTNYASHYDEVKSIMENIFKIVDEDCKKVTDIGK